MPLNNFGIVKPRFLYRSAQPDTRAAADLISLGITTVIKLNTTDEFPIEVEKQMFSDITGLLKVNLQQRRISWFRPDIEAVRDIANEIDTRIFSKERVLVHCTHGRDRTGLIIGAWRLMHCNWSLNAALDELGAFGVRGVLLEIADREIRQCLTRIAAGSK